MICKHILFMIFLMSLSSFSHSQMVSIILFLLLITCLRTVKWFQVLLFNTNYSIRRHSFVCTQLNGSKYCYVPQTIQLNISHLFTHNLIIKQFYF